MKKQTDLDFSLLWGEAVSAADKDAYVSDWALSSIWGDEPEAEIPAERINYLRCLWEAAHRSLRDILSAAGLSQAALMRQYCIPRRTVQAWCAPPDTANYRPMPAYLNLMLQQCLGLLPDGKYL